MAVSSLNQLHPWDAMVATTRSFLKPGFSDLFSWVGRKTRYVCNQCLGDVVRGEMYPATNEQLSPEDDASFEHELTNALTQVKKESMLKANPNRSQEEANKALDELQPVTLSNIKVSKNSPLDARLLKPESSNDNGHYIIKLLGNGEYYQQLNSEQIRPYWEQGYNLVLFNPRGVGRSGGELRNKADLIEDGKAVVNWLIKERQVDPKQITLEGYSLGGAVAAQVARDLNNEGKNINLFSSRSLASCTSFVTGIIYETGCAWGRAIHNRFSEIAEELNKNYPKSKYNQWYHYLNPLRALNKGAMLVCQSMGCYFSDSRRIK